MKTSFLDPFLYFFFSFMSEKSDLFKIGGVLGSES